MRRIRIKENSINFKIIILVFFLFFLPVFTQAEELPIRQAQDTFDISLTGYAETGSRATDEAEYEPEVDDSYTYHNTSIALSLDAKSIHFQISGFQYEKKYENLNRLNNESRVLNTGIFYWLNPMLKLDLDMKYRRKRYENSGSWDYDQVMVTPGITWKMPDKSSVTLSAGLNNYDYINREDESKRFIRMRGTKYLAEDKLMLTGGIRLEWLDESQQNRHRTQNKADLGLKYKADSPWLDIVSIRAEKGRGDTKDEDSDLDLDYEYWQGNVRSWHVIGDKIKTDLGYEYMKKDYILADNDYRQYTVSNGWNYDWLSLDLKHKEVKYGDRVNSNYRRETLGVGARYAKRMDWNAHAGVEGNYYRYNNSVNDKNRYTVLIGGEKVLNKQVRLGVELKWRLTDNRNSADKRDAGIRVTGEWRY
ncbi:MAG: hypothetical protein PHD29_08645 [bacterium]|nr:hypothetical protein [bacterium]MDD5755883.1 hypothetical protein [bacterium]